MNWSLRLWTWCAGPALVATALGFATPSFGQAGQPEGAALPLAAGGAYRQLAPGVMKSVEPHLSESDTVGHHDIIELVTVDPSLDWAKDIAFHREIWYLQFEFKPIRMILVDVPQANGRMQRKLIWYMVYSVSNPGKVLPSQEGADGSYQLQDSDKPIRFIPFFRLRTLDLQTNQIYPDRVIPVAVGPIQMREDANRKFYTTVEMAARELKVGETAWGVVTWEDVDSKTDRFCVYVNGLTNAYLWEDPPGAYKAGDPFGTGRKLLRKALKLNFWRPGDQYYEHEKEIRYGIPGEVDYEWVYR